MEIRKFDGFVLLGLTLVSVLIAFYLVPHLGIEPGEENSNYIQAQAGISLLMTVSAYALIMIFRK
tara:strand:- start:316 stop:510 length:195 start_codon:yes stop_codon:yes gene_type:complete